MPPIQRLLPMLFAAACGAPALAADAADDLFNLGGDAAPERSRISGYAEFGGAYTWPRDGHWSKLRARVELGSSGQLGERMRYKLSARADVDGAFDLENHYYPGAVRRNQRADWMIREAYVDFGAGEWEFRLGRQHVVWGEMVGLFFADVVSARDLREFYLPEFEALRTPQWAARAEYFAGETHFELLWIPAPSYDEIGKPGADFYPFALPAGTRVKERKPSAELSNTNWGARVSRLIDGWDLSAFHYQSRDISPTLYRLGARLETRHDRIRQTGLTFSKDLGVAVLKGEAVHTHGRGFLTGDPAARFGLKRSDTVDYVLGLDVPVQDVWRFNVQYYARVFDDHDRWMPNERHERGMTFLVNRKLRDDLEFEVLYVSSLERSDYMLRPKLVWRIDADWRAQFGADVFGGRTDGIFGRYGQRDRVYVELRRWF
ncbi:hypothetical protein E6C76_13850 [Pseudothauera nasutitermitis]|uniref:Porin n=1 Tax=Pseudothauera nasutitermitis TaxID=2565930 RepID=A0A4S4AUU0_9RHOO|nr:DUF1302 family protein [Pseudothauera nasutitermitis]THF63668.1 hypothetical protein E6C76_13850 [Pseudothauera nasutitermitis]